MTAYKPVYKGSHALVIGINQYPSSPLEFAANDAQALAAVLIEKFDFPRNNVRLLEDKHATKKNIMSHYLSFASNEIDPDDRLVFFFAGHGITRPSKREDVGFLMPVDGNVNDISTLIRWDDLTKNADLIPAKHLLFIMDACYGGLAIQRNVPEGSMRFAKDMMQRYSRQVITAGKADEPVSDGNGPRKGHSIFTGHLLNGLEGEAETADGIITANSVMSYVYQNVSNDKHSQQTPHFGFLDGDGDLIFKIPQLEELNSDAQHDNDVLISIPLSSKPQAPITGEAPLGTQIKEQLSDGRSPIKLEDIVSSVLRRTLLSTTTEAFPIDFRQVDLTSCVDRLKSYEAHVSDLLKITIPLARWAEGRQTAALEKIIARVSDNIAPQGGNTLLLAMRWYPIHLLLYAGGIAALSGNNYKNFSAILLSPIGSQVTGERTKPVIRPVVDNMLELARAEIFKAIPTHERHYTPGSEYVFKILQPMLEDELFLGRSYEGLFDRFEVLFTLIYADLDADDRNYFWGPPGRFAWKYQSWRGRDNPFGDVLEEARRWKSEWGPLKAGLFGGSFERFEKVAVKYEELMAGISWR